MTHVMEGALADAVACAVTMDRGAGSPISEKIARLRAVRKQLGWSEETCAHRLGVSFSTLHRWERGDRAPKSRVVLHAIDRFLAKYEKPKTDRG